MKLFGESIDVEAHIEVLHDISGHADQNGLLTWALAFEKKPQQFFVVHGNDDVCDRFAELLTERPVWRQKHPIPARSLISSRGVWVRETAEFRFRQRVLRRRRPVVSLHGFWQQASA